jgi:YhcH/YjgK/YiaL family protein
MKQSRSIQFILLMLSLLSLPVSGVKSQVISTTGTDKAEGWFKKGDFLNGLRLKPHQSSDMHEFARQYQGNKAGWDKAFAFMKEHNLDSLKTGKYVIDGENVFADITDNPSSPLAEAKWHSHRQYCDIIYIIKGREKIGIAPIADAPVIIPFKDKGDSQFYNQEMKGSYYISEPGTFFMFFPSDVHRPFIKAEGCDYVKRIRIKIKSVQ